mmetsp:Transcript_89007/g.237392  ORF Transcript_89007/g.237392 Transcript_89007/m.237392 type:complete len:268 (-) Transcript_89007:736-1539(-)
MRPHGDQLHRPLGDEAAVHHHGSQHNRSCGLLRPQPCLFATAAVCCGVHQRARAGHVLCPSADGVEHQQLPATVAAHHVAVAPSRGQLRSGGSAHYPAPRLGAGGLQFRLLPRLHHHARLRRADGYGGPGHVRLRGAPQPVLHAVRLQRVRADQGRDRPNVRLLSETWVGLHGGVDHGGARAGHHGRQRHGLDPALHRAADGGPCAEARPPDPVRGQQVRWLPRNLGVAAAGGKLWPGRHRHRLHHGPRPRRPRPDVQPRRRDCGPV